MTLGLLSVSVLSAHCRRHAGLRQSPQGTAEERSGAEKAIAQYRGERRERGSEHVTLPVRQQGQWQGPFLSRLTFTAALDTHATCNGTTAKDWCDKRAIEGGKEKERREGRWAELRLARRQTKAERERSGYEAGGCKRWKAE